MTPIHNSKAAIEPNLSNTAGWEVSEIKKTALFFCKQLSNICSSFMCERMLQEQQRECGGWEREEEQRCLLKTLENAKPVSNCILHNFQAW